MRRVTTALGRQGRRRASDLVSRFGAELRLARRAAGLTQRQLAMLVGVSQPFVSLVELGLRRPDWPTACAMCLAVGHDLSVRLFPSRRIGLRDSGQFADVQDIVVQAHSSWHARMEHPVSRSATDLRAADLVLIGSAEVIHLEVERGIVDFQAQLRSAQLKRAALAELLERPVRLVIAIPGTRRMREKVAALEPALRVALPLPSARVWRSIRTGAPLGDDGLLFIPRART
jgi:transcriptional regulator with XRE-family HTH domain